MQNAKIIRIHPTDNVAVALRELAAGERVDSGAESVCAADTIASGHKIALRSIRKGEAVRKYGFPIGHAKVDIAAGAHVHTHNVSTALDGPIEYAYNPQSTRLDVADRGQTFDGFVREDGSVGVRNEIWIINTVGCVNKTARALATEAARRFATRKIDGVFAFEHPFGCSQLGDDHALTRTILGRLVRHPNAGGVLVLGLGCENNAIPEFKTALGPVSAEHVKFLSIQDVDNEMEAALDLLEALVAHAETFQRQTVPASKLIVGLKCGGSDGFSGLTANPLVGAFSDALTAQGGTTILTEVPEMFGAETLLMDRCVNAEVFAKCVRLINSFKEYFQRHGQVIYENPSPGNKAGGISTLEEKSLGCTQKGGGAPVVDVRGAGEAVVKPGLNLVWAPGNDGVACTTLTAAGAQILLFTTGRGTPLGAPVPTVKISTNSELARRKAHWVDFNAGELLGGESMDSARERLFKLVLDVASGRTQTRNEQYGYREISLFKDGVTL